MSSGDNSRAMMGDLSSIEGVWQSRGYGWVFDIQPDGYRRWNVTERTADVADHGVASDFLIGFDRIDRSSPDELSFCVYEEITRYHFTRLSGLPTICLGGGTPATQDPEENFRAFWQQFADHYAFFSQKGVNWQEIHDAQVDRIGPGMSADRLLDVFAEMITPLEDAHVAVVAEERVLKVSKSATLRAFLEREIRIDPYWENRNECNRRICALYDREFLGGAGTKACNDHLLWGEIQPGIGYLAVLGEFGFSDSDFTRRSNDLPRGRRESAEFLHAELAALEPALDRAIGDLSDCRAILVDARINNGGFDVAALAVAGRFADKRRLAFSKAAWNGWSFEPRQEIDVAPAGPRQFTKPTMLLTSALTPSAGEILVLGMMALPHVTRVGESTLGILSDNLYKTLPNGWELSISNELYLAPDGSFYEGCGIPPDVEVPVFGEPDLAKGLRSSLDRAVKIAEAASSA